MPPDPPHYVLDMPPVPTPLTITSAALPTNELPLYQPTCPGSTRSPLWREYTTEVTLWQCPQMTWQGYDLCAFAVTLMLTGC